MNRPNKNDRKFSEEFRAGCLYRLRKRTKPAPVFAMNAWRWGAGDTARVLSELDIYGEKPPNAHALFYRQDRLASDQERIPGTPAPER